MNENFTQLGLSVTVPQSPENAVLEEISNLHAGTGGDYVARFTCP